MVEHDTSARNRLLSRSTLGIHTAVYAAVVTLLVIVDALTSPDKWWSHWALLGWGVVVLVHALFVFGSHPAPDAEGESGGG